MDRLLSPLLLVGLTLCLLTGCGTREPQPAAPGGDAPDSTAGSAGEKITVCLLPKQKGIPYFTSCAEGAKEAADELGNVDLIYDGPTDGSPEKAASLIERWTLQGVDVIAISPNDPEVLAPAMKKAREKGVRVLTWDADANADCREFLVNQATPQEIGYALVDTMVKDLGGPDVKAEVAIVTATLTAANQNEWIKYIKERLPKYPGLQLVATKPSNENQELARQVTQDLMKAHPNLKGIFAISSVAFPGAAEAIKQSGRAGEVLVTGLSTPNDMRAYVKDGTVTSVILWNTKDLGYLTIRAARALVDGELAKDSKTLAAGRLGERTVKGDNVLLGNILVFTKENIDDYDF